MAHNVEGFDPTSPSKASAEQVQACKSGYQHLGTIRFSGTGAYQGQAAVVLGIAQGRRTVVFVIAATNCDQVLFSISR